MAIHIAHMESRRIHVDKRIMKMVPTKSRRSRMVSWHMEERLDMHTSI
jgi:hypothetical protein